MLTKVLLDVAKGGLKIILVMELDFRNWQGIAFESKH